MDTMSDNKKYRNLILILSVTGILLFSLYFVFGRIQVSLLSNVLMSDSLWLNVLSFLQTLITICAFALFYGVSVFCLEHDGIKKTALVAAVTVALTLFKYAAILFGSLLIDRMDADTFLAIKLPTSLLSFGLELVQYAIVLTVAWFALRTPVSKSLSHSLLFISLTVTLINVASRIVYDIGYGAPTSLTEVLRMVLAYASDVLLYGVLLYVLMRLIIKLIPSYHQKN